MPKVRYLDDCDIDCCGGSSSDSNVNVCFNAIGRRLTLNIVSPAAGALGCCTTLTNSLVLVNLGFDNVFGGNPPSGNWYTCFDIDPNNIGLDATGTPAAPCDATSFWVFSVSTNGANCDLLLTLHTAATGGSSVVDYSASYASSYDATLGFVLAYAGDNGFTCTNWPATASIT